MSLRRCRAARTEFPAFFGIWMKWYLAVTPVGRNSRPPNKRSFSPTLKNRLRISHYFCSKSESDVASHHAHSFSSNRTVLDHGCEGDSSRTCVPFSSEVKRSVLLEANPSSTPTNWPTPPRTPSGFIYSFPMSIVKMSIFGMCFKFSFSRSSYKPRLLHEWRLKVSVL
jgi:hypothetical protein